MIIRIVKRIFKETLIAIGEEYEWKKFRFWLRSRACMWAPVNDKRGDTVEAGS